MLCIIQIIHKYCKYLLLTALVIAMVKLSLRICTAGSEVWTPEYHAPT